MFPAPVVVCYKKSRGPFRLRVANNIKDRLACVRFGEARFGLSPGVG